MSTSKPSAAPQANPSPAASAANQSLPLARRLLRYTLAGGVAALLLAGLEWAETSVQLTPVFASFGERLIFTAYFSMNLLSGAVIGLAVGAAFCIGLALQKKLASWIARGAIRWLHEVIAALIVCGVFAFALNQQWYAHRFAMSLIREAEKIERLNALLLNHERATSYLILLAFVIFAASLSWLAHAASRFPFWLRAAYLMALALFVGIAYTLDVRTEPLLYEHSFHQLMFVLATAAGMALVATAYSTSPRLQSVWPRLRPTTRRLMTITGLVIFIGALLFTFFYFDRNQNLKVQIFSRTVQAKKHFRLIQWAVDFDRDGYSAILGGGDLNDNRADINPGQLEVVSDGTDNNCIGGDLTRKELERWRRERESHYVAPQAGARRLNVIYVFIDALRPDRLGAYGHTRNTSPNLDKLAARGTVFENAYTPAPNTFEALPKFMQSSYWDAQLPTWTEVLAQNNYNAILFPRRIVTLLRHVRGMTVAPHSADGTFAGSVDTAIDLLSKAPADRPFAAYLYATDPHRPYRVHEGFDFGRNDNEHYDSEIAYDDHQLGRLFDWMEQAGRMKDTMVVIMADHGESLGERGVHKHSSQLYNEQSRIPMIIYVPDTAPRRVSAYVSSVDLGATILNAVGLDYPKDYAGVSLMPLLRGEAMAHPPIYAEQTTEEDSPYLPPEKNLVPNGKKYMVITQDGFKLVYNRDYYAFELFDLKNDPGEVRNLYNAQPERAAEMRALLGRYIDVVQASRPADADETQYHFGPTRGREEGDDPAGGEEH
ncbi:MAG TPA: sulfatase-like hydrolase/transferase [Blastocatellia bacterium]|nr:sulfatase-like hydrolase/transferase [Blastocatellia bacterium]